MLGKHSFSHPMHQRKKKNQVRNTKLKKKKKKTNNAYLMSQNHHQILENDRLPMEREIETERQYRKNTISSNKEQTKKKNQTSISNR